MFDPLVTDKNLYVSRQCCLVKVEGFGEIRLRKTGTSEKNAKKLKLSRGEMSWPERLIVIPRQQTRDMACAGAKTPHFAAPALSCSRSPSGVKGPSGIRSNSINFS